MSALVYVPLVTGAAPSTSLTSVNVAKSTVVLAGSTVSPEAPLDPCNCTATKPTRYARKLSVEAVLVSVTTAVPLQAARNNKAAHKGAASILARAHRRSDKAIRRDAYMGWIDPSIAPIVQPFLPQLKRQMGK